MFDDGDSFMELTQVVSRRTAAGRRQAWRRPASLSLAHFHPFVVPLSVTLLIGGWSVLARFYPAWILPGPARVWHRFVQVAGDGTLLRHTQVTLTEALLGFALGFCVAGVLGYLLARSPALERLVAPYIVASQSTPVVAVAPLLILWFGAGLLSKILVCALVVFFPMLVNTVVGLRSIDPDYRSLFETLNASTWQTFTKLELPAALPVLLGGVRVGITLSVVGAVVGEFLGSDQGLGALINIARGLFDTPLMFVALFTLIGIALVLYASIVALERTLIRWR
jgi:NitT/TauT family transport system permease protein